MAASSFIMFGVVCTVRAAIRKRDRIPPQAGFAGQEMHWTLFVYRGDADDVGASVDLSGLGGEKVGRVEGVQTDRWRLGCAIAFI